jgi:hypothetical protein
MLAIRATLAVLLVASAAIGQEKPKSVGWSKEPASYRGIPWGGSIDDARREVGASEGCLCADEEDLRDARFCKFLPEPDPKKEPRFRSCRASLGVADISVKDLLHFENEKFVGADMTFDVDEFEQMKDIFIEKYGQPSSTENTEVSNRMGAKFTNTELVWRGEKVTVRLERFGSDLTKSGASIVLTDYMQRRADAMREKKKKGAEAF